MLLAQRVRPGPFGDFSDLVPLASKAANVMPCDQLIADVGYDSEANHRFCVNATRKILRTAEVKFPSSAVQGTVCA